MNEVRYKNNAILNFPFTFNEQLPYIRHATNQVALLQG